MARKAEVRCGFRRSRWLSVRTCNRENITVPYVKGEAVCLDCRGVEPERISVAEALKRVRATARAAAELEREEG